MAHGLIYYHEFRSYSGHRYRVELLQIDYTGGNTSIPWSAGVPVRIRHSGKSKDEWDQTYVQGTELVFNFIIDQDDADTWETTILESKYKDFKLIFYSYNSIETETQVEFVGYLKPENFSKKYVDNPKNLEISLSATDALADLKHFDFKDRTPNVPYIGKATLMAMINLALSPIDLELDFAIQVNTWETSLMSSGECPLLEVSANHKAFYKTEDDGTVEYDDCYTVLEKIMQPFNCKILQHKGKYKIVNYYEEDSQEFLIEWGLTYISGTQAVTNILDVASHKYKPNLELQKIYPLGAIFIPFVSTDVGGDLTTDLNDWYLSGPWDLTSWFSAGEDPDDSNVGNLRSIMDDGVTFEYGDVGQHLTLKSNFVADYTSSKDYIQIKIKYKMTYFKSSYYTSLDGPPPMIVRVSIWRPTGGWAQYYEAPLYPAPYHDSQPVSAGRLYDGAYIQWQSPSVEFFRITESGGYNIRLEFIPKPPEKQWEEARFQVRDVEILKLSDDTVSEFQPINSVDITKWLQIGTSGFDTKDDPMYLADGGNVNQSGALLVQDPVSTSTYHNTQYWRAYGGAGGIRIADLYARNIINNRSRYKNFLTNVTIIDRDVEVDFKKILLLFKDPNDKRHYCWSSYEWDVRHEQIKGKMVELITASQAYEDATVIDESQDTYEGTPITETNIIQTTHGFVIGDPISWDSVGETYYKPKATSVAGVLTPVIGFVSDVLSTDAFRISEDLILDPEKVIGTGYVVGQYYYLSPTTNGVVELQRDVYADNEFIQSLGYITEEGFQISISPPQSPIVGTKSAVITDKTVIGTGTSDNKVELVNDQTTVNQYDYYGSNDASKGWHSLRDAIHVLLELPESGLADVINNLIVTKSEDNSQSYIVTTSSTSYTQQSTWNINTSSDAMGNFKVTAVMHDLVTDAIVSLQNTFGFDYTDVGNEVDDDNKIITDGSLTLVLNIASDGTLEATIASMTSNSKRIHFCMQKCTTKVYGYRLIAGTGSFILTGQDVKLRLTNQLTAAYGGFTLTGIDVDFGVNTLFCDTAYFTLTGQDVYFYKYNYNLVAETGSFTLTGNDISLYDTEAFITEWTVPSAAFTLPLNSGFSYNMTVDWGDGSDGSIITAWDDVNKTHTYTAGTYQIKINGVCQTLYINNSSIASYLDKIVNWGDVGFTSFYRSFFGCINLTTLPSGSITGATNIITFEEAFRYCPDLIVIPSGVFDLAINVSGNAFASTFSDCSSLIIIPTDLFKYNTGVGDGAFAGTFNACTGITTVPLLFGSYDPVADNLFISLFTQCTGITTIASGLFDSFTNAYGNSFQTVFNYCTGLTAIPSGLFDNNTSAESFQSTFNQCTGLTAIPSGLFDNNIAATNFNRTFVSCTGIITIPENLYDNCTAVTNFEYCHYNNTSVTSNVPDLWNSHDWSGLLDSSYCFYGCTNAANYGSIPIEWRT